MNNFQASGWFEYQVWWEEADADMSDLKICFGLGYSLEDILFEVVMTQIFQDCTKTIIENFQNFPDNLFGEDAKLFEWDDCTSSDDEEIELYEYDELNTDDKDEYVYGNNNYADTDA